MTSARQGSSGQHSGNSRSGKTGEMEITVPRDRNGAFEPQLVKKHQRRLPGFDDKVVSLYARGMTTREITGHLKEFYGVDVSPSLIWAVTDTVMEDVKAWQGLPLDAVYPIVYLDANHLKMRADGQVQLCIIHLVGHSLRYVSWKERRSVASDLRTIYTAARAEAAEQALDAFEKKRQARFPSIARSWRSNWTHILGRVRRKDPGVGNESFTSMRGLAMSRVILHPCLSPCLSSPDFIST